MNIQRFTGATAREALGKARMAFGEGTLILSNRPTANGVEVMATGEENLGDLQRLGSPAPAMPARPAAPTKATAPAAGTPGNPAAPTPAQQVQADTEQMAMSTLSFQDYVRERMLRKRQTETPARADEVTPRATPSPAAAVRTPAAAAAARPMARPVAREPAAGPIGTRSIVDELHAMRDLIEDRFNTFAWLNQAKQHPIQSNLMLKLMRAGYSPTLSRTILEHMPETLGAPEAMQWMMEAIERNLKTSEPANSLLDEGGIHALVGATGVGKTTTVAKLAGLCARARPRERGAHHARHAAHGRA